MRIKYITLDDDGLHVEYEKVEEPDIPTVVNMFTQAGLDKGPVAAPNPSLGEEGELFYDADTLQKVRDAINTALGFPRPDERTDVDVHIVDRELFVTACITELQNAGIKFREVR